MTIMFEACIDVYTYANDAIYAFNYKKVRIGVYVCLRVTLCVCG